MTNSTTFPGTLTCPTSLVSNVMTMGTTKTFVVTMTNASGANKYYIDGYLQASLVLHQGQTYIFDLSSGTLSGHPFEFSTTNNGSHGGGSAYSTGITTTGTYASSQKRTFVVSTSTPTALYYYCTAHSGMGGSVTISPKAELIVSGGAEFIGTGTIKLPSGTTSQRPTTGMTGMIRYNTSTGFIETYTAEGWGSIAPPPVITGISPVTVAGADTATQVFTVTGTGFDTGLTIKLVGADDTEYSVFSTTRVSGQSATFKMGANGATDGYAAAQRPFKVKVTGGDTASAVTSTSVASIALVVPTITGISPTTFAYSAVGSQTITVSGTNFASSMASGNNIQVLGADGSTLYNVNSAAVASATSITFKLAATSGSLSTGQLDNRPYKVRVTDAIGITVTSTATVSFNGIAWSSPASGATLAYDNGVSSSQNLVATDDIGGTDVTFSITSGSVGGLSLGSATASPATFSGTGSTDGTTNVTFRVTDNESGTTADRTFSVVVSSGLFSFTSHTFTHCAPSQTSQSAIQTNMRNARYRLGPTFAEMKTTYASASWELDTALFNSNVRGNQRWTVPVDGTYRIQAFGAMGGQNPDLYNYPGHSNQSGPTGYGVQKGASDFGPVGLVAGKGGVVQADYTFEKGKKLLILVGEQGGQFNGGYGYGGGGQPNIYSYNSAGGGGGASWVLDGGSQAQGNKNATGTLSDLYMVAGGGGGDSSGSFYAPHAGAENSPTSQGSAPSGKANGGYFNGAGGAGYQYEGRSYNFNVRNFSGHGGYIPAQGGMGGSHHEGNAADQGGIFYEYQEGGFGGGGSFSGSHGGGGGGYAGGQATGYTGNNQYTSGPRSQGGTPYASSNTNRSFQGNSNLANGKVIITLL
jgi:hypothetical protein